MINGKYMMLQEQIDRIVENITDMYATGCIGYVMIYADGKVVDFEHKWISKEAKDNYDLMQLKLKCLLEDQNRILGRVTWPPMKITREDLLSSSETREYIYSQFRKLYLEGLKEFLDEQIEKEKNK